MLNISPTTFLFDENSYRPPVGHLEAEEFLVGARRWEGGTSHGVLCSAHNGGRGWNPGSLHATVSYTPSLASHLHDKWQIGEPRGSPQGSPQ